MVTINEKTNAKKELNNVLKEEYKSFSALCKVIKAKEGSSVMNEFLNAYNLTFDKLIDINYLKKGLNFHTFTTSDGNQYETICRKNKAGEVVPAKWSFWLILTAAAKVRKEELKESQKKAMLAKEKSIKEIEEEEKKPASKKPASKKPASQKQAA